MTLEMRWLLPVVLLCSLLRAWVDVPSHPNVFRSVYRSFPESFLPNFCYKGDQLALPVVVLPGANDWCYGIDYFYLSVQKFVNAPVICIDYAPKSDSVYTNMQKLTDIVCKKLDDLSALLGPGFTFIGLSMGGLLARAAVQMCPMGDRVRNLITLGTPHMGVAKIPSHDVEEPFINIFLNLLYRNVVYSSVIQRFVSPTNFFKIRDKPEQALQAGIFLTKINNEREYNDAYRDRIIGLDTFMVVVYREERYLFPKETAMWGYLDYAEPYRPLNMTETKLYRQDAIGIRTLHESGRLKLLVAPGRHMNPNWVFLNLFRELIYYCY